VNIYEREKNYESVKKIETEGTKDRKEKHL
jgi:hypothetical protein